MTLRIILRKISLRYNFFSVVILILKINESLFRQVQGVPQGSILSTILCSILFADLEASEFGYLQNKVIPFLLLRFVDDFLCISPKRDLVGKFLSVMMRGSLEYGSVTNVSKTTTNFALKLKDFLLPRIQRKHGFSWCGLVIDQKTLEVSSDVERYYGGHITNTLTIDKSVNTRLSFSNKMIFYLKLKAHAIYLDTSFNTKFKVRMNVYENFMVVAMKFNTYSSELSSSHKHNARCLSGTLLPF